MLDFSAELRFGPDGLLPAIVQEASDRTVLMLAYMNREALDKTRQEGVVAQPVLPGGAQPV